MTVPGDVCGDVGPGEQGAVRLAACAEIKNLDVVRRDGCDERGSQVEKVQVKLISGLWMQSLSDVVV